MITKLTSWVKSHKLLCVLIAIIAYFWMKSNGLYIGSMATQSSDYQGGMSLGVAPPGAMLKIAGGGGSFAQDSYAPVQNEAVARPVDQPRMVSKESSMSLVVKDVRETVALTYRVVQDVQGYVISSYLSNPGENATGSVVVRVPSMKLESTLESFRKLGLKVVSEQSNGADITDQYTDLQARLKPLRQTYVELDALRSQAGKISDKMDILMQLQNLQSQIDSLVGQEKYLKESADTSRVTVYLSTDEFELPYSPNDNWRASVIFKQAVRDLVVSLRGIAMKGIYMVVYAVIWVPLVLVAYLVYKRLNRGKVNSPGVN